MNSVKQNHHLPFVFRLVESAKRILPKLIKKIIRFLPFASYIANKQLNLLAPSGLVEVIVTNGILKGIRLKLNLKTERHYWLGSYEHQLIQAIKDFCKPNMTIYDVGADIGFISLTFSRIIGRGGKVFAFEPLPENIYRIEEHIQLNSLQEHIHLVPYAVSDYDGKEEFLVYKKHILGKLASTPFRNFNYINKIKVKSLSLDNFVYRDKNTPPNIIKMDIEGGGVRAIPGMLRVISELHPIIFVELHGPEEQQIIWKTLKKYQYKICSMEKNYPEITNIDKLGPESRDFIVAVPKN